MEIYCLNDFKIEFEKLKSKKSYRDIEKEIISYFFNKTTDDLKSGTRLNNSDLTPYIKKRIKGSGGYRTYYLLIIKNDCLYLMYIHPKTGNMGAPNITDESKAYLYKKVLKSIEDNTLFKLRIKSGKIVFEEKKG